MDSDKLLRLPDPIYSVVSMGYRPMENFTRYYQLWHNGWNEYVIFPNTQLYAVFSFIRKTYWLSLGTITTGTSLDVQIHVNQSIAE